MIATEIQINILKPFIDETINSLEKMAHLKAHAGEAFTESR
jgi:hypothetical protein